MRRKTAEVSIEEIPFLNPSFPRFQFEFLTLSELRRRDTARLIERLQRPTFHLLMLVVAGRGTHYVDFERHECRRGTLLHVRPGQLQRFASREMEAQLILFLPGFALPGPTSFGANGAVAIPSAMFHLSKDEYDRIATSFAAMEREYRATDGQPLSAQVLQHQLQALLLQLTRIGDKSLPVASLPKGLRAYQRFNAEVELAFARTRQVKDYAKKLGYSTKTLHRSCLAIGGSTPKALIERRVALEAKRLLAHTTMSIGAIAGAVGFNDPTNFVKFFRRCEGMLPTKFRMEATKAR